MAVILIVIIAGPVGDYLGLDYEFFIHSQGFDSMYTITGDSGDATINDTNAIIDTLTYQGNPAYITMHVRISDLSPANDTNLTWEEGDSLFTFTAFIDTFQIKAYVTPFVIGLNWDLGIMGDTIIGDFDGDGIDDTLFVHIAESHVTDSLSVSVPLGTFDAFEIEMDIYLRGWQSFIGDSCKLWLRDKQYLSPYLGVVKDSFYIVDSIKVYNNWIWGMTVISYSEAVDTGYIGIAEQPEVSFGTIQPITNGIKISGNGYYQIEVYDIIGRTCKKYDLNVSGVSEIKPELSAGIYFARIKQKQKETTTKFLIIR